jgi:hypothetical protein
MGKTGVCWDNALAESFFATYKLEAHRATVVADPGSHTDGDRSLDRGRLQPPASALGHGHEISPVDHEDRYWNRRAAA